MVISKEEILEAIGSMSVLDLSELIKEMEDKFGVQLLQLPWRCLGGAAGGDVARKIRV